MLANNETGAIQPVVEVGEKLKKVNEHRPPQRRVKLLVDASQAVGKIEVCTRL